eukprot:CAMPEP_0178909592 /NCGR_PEP_ID=MMETSP0786-20121207/8612_1 /TAXON_ID=186022 /ORGANISM="Thalassionema frauenfeldii, Strain CCMP 1798" /LENGTH=460 /DNA_ID=CAMNT_0020581719 /DNA_START=128 /DNA_END=1506 /DNA_ORIENTATION=-
MSMGNRTPSTETVALASAESPHVPGLQVTERAEPREGSDKKVSDNRVPLKGDEEENTTSKTPIVIGTIRMGFGHHRIAYAACSWALAAAAESASDDTKDAYFHDLLHIDSSSPEADLIESTDQAYSKMSRLTSQMGGLIEKLWGSFTLSGDANALRLSGLTALQLCPLFTDLPKDTPIIASHCWVALAAVAAGFTNVINLVIDNHAQWFVVTPGCLNLVQGPSNYQQLLKLGVPPENIQLAGHWIPRELVVNVPEDCQRRMDRTGPIKLLIPVGGAGAQRKFICQFVRSLQPLLEEGKIQLLLNAGDHAHMKEAFEQVLQDMNVKEYDTIATTEGVLEFRDKLLATTATTTTKPVTLFSFAEYFPAVATTDILGRVADVLCCKPSELAFYPIPKLLIRRVGDHEQYSAWRAAELGDGTLEAREVQDCLDYLQLFLNSDALEQMNRSIIKNQKQGVYNGCQ